MNADLDADDLVAGAFSQTGLEDLGDIPYREALEVLVESLNRDAGLDPGRLETAGSTIVGLLVKRLRLVDDRKRYPAISEETIGAPLFIVGLPRSGSTHLHALLGQVGGVRVPLYWEMIEQFGTITTVVNNAAATDLTGPGPPDSHVEEIDADTFEAVMRTGLFGVLWTSKYAIPHMKKGDGGAIINISAASSLRAIEGRPAYQASKGAINALTRQMAVDYGLFGIRSNAIIVGFTPTGGEVITKMVQNEAFISAVKRAIPSPRLGSPRDIANGCVYLASDEAEYVNGVLLPIDGGLTCKLGIPDTSALSAIADD